jgi:protoheme IX farnesyltransferase
MSAIKTLSFPESCLSRLNDYLTLCKPKVVLLMVFTAWVGMFLASPDAFPLRALVFGTLGIALSAGSAAALNHVVDRQIDARMSRTRNRPLACGNLAPAQCLIFAGFLGVTGMVILVSYVNMLTAVLTFFSLIGYAVVYTLYLKRATPQNIVIGGVAGATPPLLGWTAVTGQVDAYPLILLLVIFTWTPPHFWALALYRKEEYTKVGIPMLPVTHGDDFTRLQILLYTLLLTVVTLLPFLIGENGLLYLIGVVVLDALFLYKAIQLIMTRSRSLAIKTFMFSITYLFGLFALLLLDRYIPQLLERLMA